MPVMPSFSGYAPTPNLAQAWLGGQNLQLERQKLSQQAAEASQRASIAYAELQNRRVIAEMEMAAHQATLARENLIKQQNLEMQKAYHDSQIGIQEQELKFQQQKELQDIIEAKRAYDLNLKNFGIAERGVKLSEEKQKVDVADAARQFEARKTLFNFMKQGMPASEAVKEVPELDLPPTAISQMIRPPEPAGAAIGTFTPAQIPGKEGAGWVFRSGENNAQYIPEPGESPTSKEQTSRMKWRAQYDLLTKKIAEREKLLEPLLPIYSGKTRADFKRKAELEEFDKYVKLKAELDSLMEKQQGLIDSDLTSTAAPAISGTNSPVKIRSIRQR